MHLMGSINYNHKTIETYFNNSESDNKRLNFVISTKLKKKNQQFSIKLDIQIIKVIIDKVIIWKLDDFNILIIYTLFRISQ